MTCPSPPAPPASSACQAADAWLHGPIPAWGGGTCPGAPSKSLAENPGVLQPKPELQGQGVQSRHPVPDYDWDDGVKLVACGSP